MDVAVCCQGEKPISFIVMDGCWLVGFSTNLQRKWKGGKVVSRMRWR